MKNTVKGKFTIAGTPDTTDVTAQEIGAIRMRFDKVFEGALSAQGTVTMIGILNKELGSGGYVAIERISGSLDGRRGSFCLQHSCAMNRNTQEQNITVIADTGTEQLKGIAGRMTIDIEKDGQHFYNFEYEIL